MQILSDFTIGFVSNHAENNKIEDYKYLNRRQGLRMKNFIDISE